ncbi:uncharacterized protein K02A2.6-like [Macrobrachium nipponense]|uniref:uncharacterized protein K02A2.6-like n=1 Tax=Macrobrachium nipponense TaxID=159736 RepID=UPI0030C83592
MGKPNQIIPKAPLNPIPVIGGPFVELVIDVVGPLPKTKSGLPIILTIMDRASRFPEAFPMRRITSKVVFDKLIEFFSRYGLPCTVQIDCGTNFTSKVFKDLFQNSPGRTNFLEHDVDVGNASPVKQSPYRLNPVKRDKVDKEIKYMLEHDLIQPSVSPWSSR